jgi:hypothetical protein
LDDFKKPRAIAVFFRPLQPASISFFGSISPIKHSKQARFFDMALASNIVGHTTLIAQYYLHPVGLA